MHKGMNFRWWDEETNSGLCDANNVFLNNTALLCKFSEEQLNNLHLNECHGINEPMDVARQ